MYKRIHEQIHRLISEREHLIYLSYRYFFFFLLLIMYLKQSKINLRVRKIEGMNGNSEAYSV